MELSPDNLGGRVADMGDSEGEPFSNSCCYFYVAWRDLEEILMG